MKRLLFCFALILIVNGQTYSQVDIENQQALSAFHIPTTINTHTYSDLDIVDSTNSLKITSIKQDLTNSTVYVYMKVLDKSGWITASSRRSGGNKYKIKTAGRNYDLTKITDISFNSQLRRDNFKIWGGYIQNLVRHQIQTGTMIDRDEPGHLSKLNFSHLNEPSFTLIFSKVNRKLDEFTLTEGFKGSKEFKSIKLGSSLEYSEELNKIERSLASRNLNTLSLATLKKLFDRYQNFPKVTNKIFNEAHSKATAIGNIAALHFFYTNFDSSSSKKLDTVDQIWKLVLENDSVPGYGWFIKNYSSESQSRIALHKMHSISFSMAKDLDTISAYNDFVIAYPTAKQVTQANDRAYELEKSEYVSIFSYFTEEKDARRLLVQSKLLEQSSEDMPNNERAGYMIIVNRMNNLLKQEFNSTDAVLRHLESNEFKSFVNLYKRTMRDLKQQVSRIADNTKDLTTIMQQQSTMMNNHFEDAAQDRELASKLTKQHRHWERFVGEVGQ